MNGTLITAFLRQRMTSPIRLVFLVVTMFFPLLFVAAAPATGFSSLETSLNFALIFGAGMIGQDTASGVLQLLFARPVRRDVYVISRWVAASLAAALMAVVQVGLVALILAARGARPEVTDVAIAWANHITSAFGVTAPLLALSALVPGLADLGLLLLIYTVAGILQVAGGAMNQAIVAQISHVMQDFVNPMIDFHRVLGPAPSWNEIVSYVSTVTLSLALAIVFVNRKELSYAATS
jgi:ABC-type transport system involved in multi-copper enzyme maturation permease subunit